MAKRRKKNSFRFTETFTNVNGKTSGSGFIGVILGIIAGCAFTAAMIGWFLEIPQVIEVMGKILELAFASALLMGVRKAAPKFGKDSGSEMMYNPYVDDEEIEKG